MNNHVNLFTPEKKVVMTLLNIYLSFTISPLILLSEKKIYCNKFEHNTVWNRFRLYFWLEVQSWFVSLYKSSTFLGYIAHKYLLFYLYFLVMIDTFSFYSCWTLLIELWLLIMINQLQTATILIYIKTNFFPEIDVSLSMAYLLSFYSLYFLSR